MSKEQAYEELKNIRDMVENNLEEIEDIKIALREIKDNGKGLLTSLKYIENTFFKEEKGNV